jgi:hypothetical protein
MAVTVEPTTFVVKIRLMVGGLALIGAAILEHTFDQGGAMFSDADHEIIDSPEALFRHLYEEHGVEEAADLDPETAPIQFWLRRHTELERAERSARRQPGPPPDPEPIAEPRPEPRRAPRPEPRREEPRPEPRGRGEAPFQPPRSQPPPAREGRRHAGFGDPLLEAMTRALVGRGHDEAAVRSAIRSFPAAGGHPGGEAGVRAAFVEPMLRSVAEHLLAPEGPRRPPARPQPPPATAAPATAAPAPSAPSAPPPPPRRPAADRHPPPAPPKAREDPARPEAVWAGLWADLAEPSRRAGEGGAGAAGDDGDDLMAVANAVQARRRVRLLRR